MSDVEFVEYVVIIIVSAFFLAIAVGYVIDCTADDYCEWGENRKERRNEK